MAVTCCAFSRPKSGNCLEGEAQSVSMDDKTSQQLLPERYPPDFGVRPAQRHAFRGGQKNDADARARHVGPTNNTGQGALQGGW